MTRLHKQTRLWQTREGTKVRVCDMGDRHLLNAIRMLERGAEARWQDGFAHICLADDMITADIASAEIEGHLIAFLEDEADIREAYLPSVYYAMVVDARRRGLKVVHAEF